MLNKEKFAKEIFDMVCDGHSIAVNRNNVPVPCNAINCSDCIFNDMVGILCSKARKNWCNSEYRELEVDWTKVPVDTPILVRNIKPKSEDDIWEKRHFSKYTDEGGVESWADGTTSWTAKHSIGWRYAKLANEEDIKKYAKCE